MEQGPYWERSYQPADQVRARQVQARPRPRRLPGHRRDPAPVPRAGDQAAAQRRAATRPYDDVEVNGTPDGRVQQREAFIRDAYKGADATMRLAQERMRDRDLTTFVSSDHGFAPQFAAIDASKVLVDLGLLSRPQTANCRRGHRSRRSPRRRRASPAARCRSTSTSPGATRRRPTNGRPAGRGRRRGEHRSPRSGPPSSPCRTPTTGPATASPRAGRSSTASSPRRRRVTSPTAPNSTADMAHPTRTGDVVVFSTPPYQFDAATPGTLIARSAFFGQHGYVPDVQDLESNTNMRATFLAGGDAIKRGVARDVRSIDLAPTAAFLLDVPAPQHSQGVVRRDLLDQRAPLHAAVDHRAQRLPRSARPDDDAASTTSTSPSAARRRWRRCSTRRPAFLPEPSLLLAAGDNVGASPPNSALLEDTPAIDVENAWGLDATSFGNHEFDFGRRAHPRPRGAGRTSRSCRPTSSSEDTGEAPDWVRRRRSSGSTASASASSGRRCDDARAREGRRHRGPRVPRRGRAASAASPRGCGRWASRSRSSSSTRAPSSAPTRSTAARRRRGQGPIMQIVEGLQEHDGRPRHRRSHPPDRQHGRRAHPGRRGRQRRRQLLGGAADGQGRRRRLGRRGDARGQEHRRRAAGPTCRRSSTQANAETAVAAQRGHRHAEVDIRRDPTRLSESAMGNMVADAMRLEVPGRRRRDHELRRPAPGHPLRRRRPRASSPTRSRGARCSRCCPSATGR